MPQYIPDPTPDERRHEIAKLLATALLRFHRRVPVTSVKPQESFKTCLDVAGETRLSVATGSAGERGERPRERQTS